MASVQISIANDAVLSRFHSTLDQAGAVASDMIQVKTKVSNGTLMKVVRTECPWAISVFRSLAVVDVAHD
ncbi:MAG: hypothetical protein AAGL99_17065 [Pseudomonadota bacterium]